MSHHPLALLCTLILLGSAAVLEAEISVTGKEVAELKPFDELMVKFLEEHQAAGAAVAVAKDGEILYSRGFGLADREKMVAVEPQSLFRIASISKPVTAVAVLQLVERGKLKLSDRVVDVLKLEIPAEPKGDARWKEITILHLLQHTAGFDRGKSFDPMFKAREFAAEQGTMPPAGPREVIASMVTRRLDFSPGERMAYSNIGYCLLGRVIEQVSGQGYEAYVKEQVLKPVGVTRMRIGATRTTAAGEVRYYDRGGKKGENVFAGREGEAAEVAVPYGVWHLEAMDAHGGWIASAPDLLKFATIADAGRKAAVGHHHDEEATLAVLGAESVRVMFARPVFTGKAQAKDKAEELPAVFYGCGWSVRVVGENRINTWHTGGLGGTSTLLVRRHDGLSWAVLFNGDSAADGGSLAAKIDPMMHAAAGEVKKWPTGKK